MIVTNKLQNMMIANTTLMHHHVDDDTDFLHHRFCACWVCKLITVPINFRTKTQQAACEESEKYKEWDYSKQINDTGNTYWNLIIFHLETDH